MVVSQEIELSGHIIDSGIMTQVFDRVMDMGGNFEILVFDVGKEKTDPSYARLRIAAANREKLGFILSELHRLGARPLEVKDVHVVLAERDRVGPKGFYLTTNHPTEIKFIGEWIPVECIEMDCLIVMDKQAKRSFCTPLAKIKKGDLIVVGEQGVKVQYPERPASRATLNLCMVRFHRSGPVSP